MSNIYDQLGEACRRFGEKVGMGIKEAYDLMVTNGRRERNMSKTKVIEVFEGTQMIMQIGTDTKDRVVTVAVSADDLEELNSDYINEHYDSLQDEAYQQGLEDGKKAFDLLDAERGSEYRRGLDDAWEAARKISLMSPDEIEKVFPGAAKYNRYNLGYSGVEAIAKLKAYEEKAENEIKVGDEVVWTEDENVVIVVTRVYTAGNMEWCDGVCRDGKVYHILTEHARKTGRRFEIDKILEEMKA